LSEIRNLSNTDGSNVERFYENQFPSTLNNGGRALEAMLSRGFKDTFDGHIITTGTGSAYVAAPNRSFTASATMYNGAEMFLRFNAACADSPTLNVGATDARLIFWPDGTTLSASDIIANSQGRVKYNTSLSAWILMDSPVPAKTAIRAASETVAGKAELATLAEAKALDASRIVPADKIASWLGPILDPGGRLTLTTATPVMTADVLTAATIYYALYKHAYVPLWTGTVWGLYEIAELSLALDSDSGHTGYHESGKNFDLFIYNDAGTIRLCSGPAWTDDDTRADAIARKDGRWTNNASIVLRFDASASTVTAAANTALFVGTFRASANGQTEWSQFPAAAAGGSNNKLLLWNLYNQVLAASLESDSDASWTYTTDTYRSANNSDLNRISFIAGLAGGNLRAHAQQRAANSSANISRDGGIGYDSVLSNSGLRDAGGNANAGVGQTMFTTHERNVEIGFHFVQMLEKSVATGTATWTGGGVTVFGLNLELMM